MTKFRYRVLITFTILLCTTVLVSQTKIPKKSIEKFELSAYTSTIDNSDSLKISIYMQIPNFVLQYVKRDSQFIAKYDATIAIQTKKGKQLGREVWLDSIIVDNYQSTKSMTEHNTLFASYKIPSGKYRVVGNLLDLDTKKVGKNNINIDVSGYKNKRFLHPPVMIEDIEGKWGFGDDLIPAIANISFNADEGLQFYLSGKVTKGKYSIKNEYLSKNGKILYTETINDTSQTGVFQHLVKLPGDKIKGLGVTLKTQLIQKNDILEESTKVFLKKVGISYFINDIDAALDQMRYILSSKEFKKVKKTSRSNSEDLFKKLWKERDPTPNTSTNELMNEYYRRVSFANTHFESFKDGWETDMGMVYIILGPPDDIEKYMSSQYQEPYEVWYYYRIQENFTFIGDNFGNYTLLTPFLGYRR